MKRLFRNFFGGDSQEASVEGQHATQDSIEFTDGSSYSYSATDEEATTSKAPAHVPSSNNPVPDDEKTFDGSRKPLNQSAELAPAIMSVSVPAQDQLNRGIDSESSHFSLRLRQNQTAQRTPGRHRAGIRIPNATRPVPYGTQSNNLRESVATSQIATISNLNASQRQTCDVSEPNMNPGAHSAHPFPLPKLPHLTSAKTTSGIIGHPGNVGAAEIESATFSALLGLCKDLGVPASGTKEDLKKRALAKISKPYYRGEVTQPLGTSDNPRNTSDVQNERTSNLNNVDSSGANMHATDNPWNFTTTTAVASRSMTGHAPNPAQRLSLPLHTANMSNPQPSRSDQKVSNSAAELSSTDLFKFDHAALLSTNNPNVVHQARKSRSSFLTESPVPGDPFSSVDNRGGSLATSTAQRTTKDRTGPSIIFPGQMTGSEATPSEPQPGAAPAAASRTTNPRTTTPTTSVAGRPPTGPPTKHSDVARSDADNNIVSESLPKNALEDKKVDVVPQESKSMENINKDNLLAMKNSDGTQESKPFRAVNESRDNTLTETHLEGIRLQDVLPAQSEPRNLTRNTLEGLDEFSPVDRKLPKAFAGAEGGPQDINPHSIGQNNCTGNPSVPPSIRTQQRPASHHIPSAFGTPNAQTFLIQPDLQPDVRNSSRPMLPTLAPVRPTPVRRTVSGFATPSDIIRTFNRYIPRHPTSNSAMKEGAPTSLFKHGTRPSSERLASRNFHRLSGSAFGVQLFPDGEQNRRTPRWGNSGNIETPLVSQGFNSKRHSTGMSLWSRRTTSVRGGQLTDLRQGRRSDNPTPLVKLNELEAKDRWKRNDQAVEMASSAKRILEALKRTSRENRELCANRKPLKPLSAPPSLKRARDDEADLEKVEKRLRRAAKHLASSNSRRGALPVPSPRLAAGEHGFVSSSPYGARKRHSAPLSKSKQVPGSSDRKRRLGLARLDDDEVNMKRSSKRRSFSSAAISAFKEVAASSSPTSKELTRKRRGFSTGYSSNIEADFKAFASSESQSAKSTKHYGLLLPGDGSPPGTEKTTSHPVHDQNKPQFEAVPVMSEKQGVNTAFSLSAANENKETAPAVAKLPIESDAGHSILDPIQSSSSLAHSSFPSRRADQNTTTRKSIVKSTPEGEKRAPKSVTFGPTFTVAHQGEKKGNPIGFSSSSFGIEKEPSSDQSKETEMQFPKFTIPETSSAIKAEHDVSSRDTSLNDPNTASVNDAGVGFKFEEASALGIPKESKVDSVSSNPHLTAEASKLKTVLGTPQSISDIQAETTDGGSSKTIVNTGFKPVSSPACEFPKPLAGPQPSSEEVNASKGLEGKSKVSAEVNEAASLHRGEPGALKDNSETVDEASVRTTSMSFGANSTIAVEKPALQGSLLAIPNKFEPSKHSQTIHDISSEKKDATVETSAPFSTSAAANPFRTLSTAVMSTAPSFSASASQPSTAPSAPSAPSGAAPVTFAAAPFGTSPAFGSSSGGFVSSSGGFGTSSAPVVSSGPFGGSSSTGFAFGSSSATFGSASGAFGGSSGANNNSTAFGTSTAAGSGFQTPADNNTAPAFPFAETPLGSTGSFGNSGFPSTNGTSSTPFLFGGSQQPSFGSAAPTPFVSNSFGTTSAPASSYPFGSTSGSNSNHFGTSNGSVSNNPFASNAPFGTSGGASSSNPFGSSTGAATVNSFGGPSGSNPFGAPSNTTPFGESEGFGQPNSGLQGSAFGVNAGQPSTGLSAAAQNMFNAPAAAGSGGNFSIGTQSQGARRGRKILRARRMRR